MLPQVAFLVGACGDGGSQVELATVQNSDAQTGNAEMVHVECWCPLPVRASELYLYLLSPLFVLLPARRGCWPISGPPSFVAFFFVLSLSSVVFFLPSVCSISTLSFCFPMKFAVLHVALSRRDIFSNSHMLLGLAAHVSDGTHAVKTQSFKLTTPTL